MVDLAMLTKDRLEALPEWQALLSLMRQAKEEVTELAMDAATLERKEYFHGYRDCLNRIMSLPEEVFNVENKGEEKKRERPSLFNWTNPIV